MNDRQKKSPSDDLIRSNPVQALHDWMDCNFRTDNAPQSRTNVAAHLNGWAHGDVSFPEHAVKELEDSGRIVHGAFKGRKPKPRVVGLLYDDIRHIGFVNPLTTSLCQELRHSSLLPFEARDIQTLLVQLCDKAFPESRNILPERLAFSFDGTLNHNCIGNSMHIAGLLSALDSLSDKVVSIFDRACAVVEMGPEGRLIPVGHVEDKLTAFLREYGRGSLLVRATECKASNSFVSDFDDVWSVESFDQLADHLIRIDEVRRPLTDAKPVGEQHMSILLSHLRRLEGQRCNADTIRICERVGSCGLADEVVHYDRVRMRKYHADALRHSGRFADSLDVCVELERDLNQLPESLVSSEELLSHHIDKAAALIDSCDYRGALEELDSWLDIAQSDAQRFSAGKRVELFNTAGRCLVLLNQSGWEELFAQSIDLQGYTDRGSIPRTESYLVHGLLRTNRLDVAAAYVDKHETLDNAGALFDGFTFFHRVDLDRRRGDVTNDVRLSSEGDGYTHAFALQAAARQDGRQQSNAIELCEIAQQTLQKEIKEAAASGKVTVDRNILNLFDGAAKLTRASFSEDENEWSAAIGQLQSHIQLLNTNARDWFAGTIEDLRSGPSKESRERFLGLLPYI